MVRTPYRVVSTLGAALFAVTAGTASAQWQTGYDPCNPCVAVQPVMQTCYQSVPVTEFRQVRQTVKKPVLETKYVERPVTEYRQVVETRTAEVPTVTYHNVTECRTVTRDNGHWITRYEQIPRLSPCEYDNRPGLLGILNRTSFSIRQAFTPKVIARREYVPSVTTQVVPVTRQVAVRGTQQVTYNVAKLVPYTTTKRVAVNTVRYVDEEVVALRPVTVMRTVPIGTRTAYAFAPVIASPAQTALLPTAVPDPVSSARADERRPRQTANSQNDRTKTDAFVPDDSDDSQAAPPPFEPGSAKTQRSSYTEPNFQSVPAPASMRAENSQSPSPATSSGSRLSIVRVSGWKARQPAAGPTLPRPTISVADSGR